MKLIIGCPVYKRDWILPYWFECIEKQTFPLHDIGFVFELGNNDPETHDALFNWQAAHPEVSIFDAHIDTSNTHAAHPEGKRLWTIYKYYTMVELRNSLLRRVRCYEPDYYFSLDSDILLENENTISELISICERDDVDAVSPLAYMAPTNTQYPSVMSWKENGSATRMLHKYPIGELFEADVIMAAKMMSKKVYQNVNYRYHRLGEDLGWSDECRRQGFRLWCASHIYVPHIMHRSMLDEYLANGDPRKGTVEA